MSPRPNAGSGEETVQAHNVIRNSLNRESSRDLTMYRFNDCGLHVGLRFWQANDFAVFFPLAALLQKLDTFEAFQHISPRGNGARPF